MPEFGDVEASYWSVGEVAFDASVLDASPTFDAYQGDVPATASEIEDLTKWVGGRNLVNPELTVTSTPTKIDYGANIAPGGGSWGLSEAMDKFGDIFDFSKILGGIGGLGADIGGAVIDTPLFKIPGFVDSTIKGVPDTPLLKLASGVGDTAGDVIDSVGGFGAIGAMLPFLIIMMLMKK